MFDVFGARHSSPSHVVHTDYLLATLGIHISRDDVYRIAREAVVNAYKHANAQSIEVELEYGSRELHVIVRDERHGIRPDVLQAGRDGDFGLAGVRERALTIGAQLTVRSGDHRGTEVELVVPNAIGFDG